VRNDGMRQVVLQTAKETLVIDLEASLGVVPLFTAVTTLNLFERRVMV